MIHVNFQRYRAHAASPAVRVALIAAGIAIVVPLLAMVLLAVVVGAVVFAIASLILVVVQGFHAIVEGVTGPRTDRRRNVRVISRP